jgi:Restriction endonuclease
LSKWKEFESLIADIQAQTAPGAIVKHNQRVLGKSGRRRQLDITISQNIGLYPVLIVIECKHYKHPVSIEKVEAFVTKLRDVSASNGVMISNAGFDDGAKAIAKENHIILISYREAQEVDWRKVVGEWTKFIITGAENISLSAIDASGTEMKLPPSTTLLNEQGSTVCTAKEFFQRFNDDFVGELELGPFKCELTPAESLYMNSSIGLKQIQAIVITGVVKGWEHTFNLRLTSGHVLENTLTQQELYNQVVTTSIDWREALKTHPCREISQEEYEAIRSSKQFLPSPSPVNLSKVKRYLRLVFTQKPKES